MKTKIFGIMHWIIVGLNIFDAFWVVMILCSGQLTQMTVSELIFSLVIMSCMMIFLPIVLLIYSLLTYSNRILVNETGFYRIRFNKIIRHITWIEVNTIGFTSEDTFTGWGYVSNVENIKYSYCEISKMMHNPNVIYFHLTKKNRLELEAMIDNYLNK